MEMIADILLVAGAIGAGFYCFVLSRRLNRFNDLEKGVGGAVAVLSAQVEDLKKSLTEAKLASDGSNETLEDLTRRAEHATQKLELMMASLHDVAEDPLAETAADPVPEPQPSAETEARPTHSGPMFVRHDRNPTQVQQ